MKLTCILLSSLFLCAFHPLPAAAVLTPQSPVELTGTQGRFDFIKIDSAHGRLLACHTGNGSLDIIDVATSKLIKSVPTGAAQGVAIDEKGGRYFVSASKPPKMVIIDSTKLEVIGEVPLPDPADLVAYQPSSNRVLVCNDTKPQLWIIDPEAKKILTTLTFPGGGMEDLGFDSTETYLFQCLKESSELAKIDPKMGQVLAHWPTAPSEKPHGLAMVPEAGSVLLAGGTGQLSLMDLAHGRVTASTAISPRVDEIAYDPGVKTVYCASGLGNISVVTIGDKMLGASTSVPSAQGAHSIAVDPRTRTVWIVFARDGIPYVQSFLNPKK